VGKIGHPPAHTPLSVRADRTKERA